MSEARQNEATGHSPSLQTSEAGPSKNVSTLNKKTLPSSPGRFVRVGIITPMVTGAFRITYDSFGQPHSALLGIPELQQVARPGAPAVDVYRVTENPDGSIVSTAIGKAWRSRHGRALMVRTVDSDGEIMTPWKKFLRLTEGRATYAYLSRFEGDPS